MAEADEIIKAVESAQDGNWIPITVVCAIFGIVVMLLLYIWKRKMSDDERRHSTNERIMEKLTDNQTDLRIIVKGLETKTESLENSLSK